MPSVPLSNTRSNMNNKLYTYPHVEDYIEIIAGYREPNGKSNYSIFTVGTSPLSLARYDMKIIPSLAELTLGGRGYTDRQAKLAAELVIKYERQLFKLGIDVRPVCNPQYRMPLRDIDRSNRVWLENDNINIKFPYIVDVIELIRTESKLSKGSIQWDHNKKYWVADLTEYNLNWVYTFSKSQNFEIDPVLQSLMDRLLTAEQTPHKIELQAKDKLVITNAHDSLTDYIKENLGGFGLDNLLPLVDAAPLLGYTVEKIIEETVIDTYGTRFWSLCANRELKANTITDHSLVKNIAEYANATNRFPIFVYEPDLSNRLLDEFTTCFPDQVYYITDQQLANFDADVKVIYTTKIPKTPVKRIPLLISSAGMLFGGDRQIWVQNAEKVVYFTKDVYNKNNKDKGKKVCKLD